MSTRLRKCLNLVRICGWIHSKCAKLEQDSSIKAKDITELASLVAEVTLQYGHNFQGRSLAAMGMALTKGTNSCEIIGCMRNLRNALINLMADQYQFLNISEDGSWHSKSIKPTEASALRKKLLNGSIPVSIEEIPYCNNVVLQVSADKPELVVKALQEVMVCSNSTSISEVRKLL